MHQISNCSINVIKVHYKFVQTLRNDYIWLRRQFFFYRYCFCMDLFHVRSLGGSTTPVHHCYNAQVSTSFPDNCLRGDRCSLVETWTEAWGGGQSRRISAEKNVFAVPPKKCDIWGDGRGLTVFVNFNI